MYLLFVISFVLQQGCYGENVIEFNNVVKNVVLLSSPLEIFEFEDQYFCMLEYVTYCNICKSVNFNPIYGICLLFDTQRVEVVGEQSFPMSPYFITSDPK